MNEPQPRRYGSFRDEAGMTMIELMVGIVGALIIIAVAFAAIVLANQLQTRTIGRIDAAQRGRVAINDITDDIRAEMCLPLASGTSSNMSPAMIWASGDGLQFYASLAPAGTTPGAPQSVEMRRLEWIKTGAALNSMDTSAQPVGKIVETVWRSTNTKPPYSFPTAATTTNTIAVDVEHTLSSTGIPVPIFQYYTYDVAAGQTFGRPSSTPLPLIATTASAINPLGNPSLVSTDDARVILVAIQFNARPRAQASTDGGRSGTVARPTPVVPFYNKVSVRTADPSQPGLSPLCS
jgi:type II secretory pathway pseudopilin PulG